MKTIAKYPLNTKQQLQVITDDYHDMAGCRSVEVELIVAGMKVKFDYIRKFMLPEDANDLAEHIEHAQQVSRESTLAWCN